MTRDPLEELFASSPEESKPVPARDRLAYEQAERLRTAELATAPQAHDVIAKAKPWIVVGIVAVVAIVASILVVNMAAGETRRPRHHPQRPRSQHRSRPRQSRQQARPSKPPNR